MGFSRPAGTTEGEVLVTSARGVDYRLLTTCAPLVDSLGSGSPEGRLASSFLALLGYLRKEMAHVLERSV